MDIFNIYFDKNYNLVVETSVWLILVITLGIIIYLVFFRKVFKYDLVKLNIKLGNIGSAEFRPNRNDLQIAHKIWTELVTRKAAIPIDKENDVIDEIYNSWYALFQKIREYISDIPADKIKKDKSTRELVRIATQTLNDGLRPHLTRWQARFRAWKENNKEKLKDKTPQEIQRDYPEYADLIKDLEKVNEQLIQYAGELKKIIGS